MWSWGRSWGSCKSGFCIGLLSPISNNNFSPNLVPQLSPNLLLWAKSINRPNSVRSDLAKSVHVSKITKFGHSNIYPNSYPNSSQIEVKLWPSCGQVEAWVEAELEVFETPYYDQLFSHMSQASLKRRDHLTFPHYKLNNTEWSRACLSIIRLETVKTQHRH